MPLLIDPGASRAATGFAWGNSWIQTNQRQFTPISEKFRFGGGTTHPSLGAVALRANVHKQENIDDEELTIKLIADVVPDQAPLLMSETSMGDVSAHLNFQTNLLTVGDCYSDSINFDAQWTYMLAGANAWGF